MDTEIELKVRLSPEDIRTVRKALQRIGGQARTSSQTEVNVLFDYPDERLRKSGCALRLRAYDGACLLTFKGPVENDPLLKKRPEIQTGVSHAEQTKELLSQLGLLPRFLYSKEREIWTWETTEGVVEICLDETPVGCFLEIEGQEKAIQKAAALLEVNLENAVSESYVSLYAKAGLGLISHEP